ncbi:hypothetical protein [Desulfobulbus sp.]|uniref:hypothetical protein n=1 Tax=Desulfobulbus sp. TaxID=895 RepID=UPI00286F6A94|nr:hypothetical protein [Desulfobulbus sp.]
MAIEQQAAEEGATHCAGRCPARAGLWRRSEKQITKAGTLGKIQLFLRAISGVFTADTPAAHYPALGGRDEAAARRADFSF